MIMIRLCQRRFLRVTPQIVRIDCYHMRGSRSNSLRRGHWYGCMGPRIPIQICKFKLWVVDPLQQIRRNLIRLSKWRLLRHCYHLLMKIVNSWGHWPTKSIEPTMAHEGKTFLTITMNSWKNWRNWRIRCRLLLISLRRRVRRISANKDIVNK